MKSRKWVGALVAVVGGAGLTVAMPAMSAVGQGSAPAPAVKINKDVTLLARGVAAKVVLKVDCPGGSSSMVTVTLSEVTGKVITTGQSSLEVTCTGSFQQVPIIVEPFSRPFKKGSALAQADVFACGLNSCESAQATKVVQIS